MSIEGGSLIRQLRNKMSFDTATGEDELESQQGIRIQIADWDVTVDAVVYENGARLGSVGSRTMWAKMTFIWVGGKIPCWITPSARYLIILDLDGLSFI